MINVVLTEHNRYRNQIALGNVPDFPSASRMATISWDATLAQLAELNVRQCEMKHDECRSTNDYRYAGQNLCMSGSYLDGNENPQIISDYSLTNSFQSRTLHQLFPIAVSFGIKKMNLLTSE